MGRRTVGCPRNDDDAKKARTKITVTFSKSPLFALIIENPSPRGFPFVMVVERSLNALLSWKRWW
jgi:hypothetical protein